MTLIKVYFLVIFVKLHFFCNYCDVNCNLEVNFHELFVIMFLFFTCWSSFTSLRSAWSKNSSWFHKKKCLFLSRKQCREHFPVKLKWEVVTGEALSNSNNNINKLARPPVGQSTYKLLLRMRVNSNKQSRWVAGPNWEIIIKYSLITERGPDIRFTLDISCNTFKWKNKKWQICLVSRPLVPA